MTAHRSRTGPVRVLHVFGRMDRGGAETWMTHVARAIDRSRFQLDFLVHSDAPGAYDDTLRSAGCRVIPCTQLRRPWTYARRFLQVLRRHGPYDAVHSHVHHYSGFVLALAALGGVPVRIAHSHNDTRVVDRSAGPARRGYVAAMNRLIRAAATHGFACSEPAAAALFGPRWSGDARWRVLYCALDLSPFRQTVDRERIRRELSLSGPGLVIGHVGRFDPQKNHAFLLEVAAEVVARDPTAMLLLVGDGPLRPAMERRSRELGIADRVRFAGVRPDVPALLGAVDALVFPSLYEGVGLAVVEAQAAGLPVFASDRVPSIAAVAKGLVTFLPLDAGAARWADAIVGSRGARRDRAAALEEISRSPFSLPAGVPELQSCYAGARAEHP